MYADDTAIFYTAKDHDELQLSIQYDLQAISYWMQTNRLSLNVKKTKVMMIGSKRALARLDPLSVSLNGEQLEHVNEFKYLGVYVDCNLSMNAHVDKLVDKVLKRLGLLYKTRWLFDLETAKMLYQTLILPHFDFGDVVYSVVPQYQYDRLQKIQNAACRLILLSDPYQSVYQLHEQLGLDTLAMRREKSLIKLTYKCMHEMAPPFLCNLLVPTIHEGRVTRATEAGVLDVPRVKTNYGKCCFGYRAPSCWNRTECNIKAAVSINQLKAILSRR